MKTNLYIGIGGFFGAILRFFVKNIYIIRCSWVFPLNTLAVNVVGSFILAFFLTLTLEHSKLNANTRLAVSTGFLGAFTTFSTLCKEAFELISKAYYAYFYAYILSSILLGLCACFAGIALAGLLQGREVQYEKK